ncbi:MAG: tyrosine protein phosphatase [Dehalococcoidia bacterium]
MARLYWVEGFSPVRIAVVERPRGGDWLDGEMRALRAAGLDILVSALQPLEVRETWLEREAEAATAAGIEFLSFPIGNMLTPVMSEALPVLEELAADLREGRSVAAHCHASQGRGPTIVASLLTLLGHDPAEVWARIRLARGLVVPDTDAQRRWVAELVRHARRDWRGPAPGRPG